MDHLSQCRTAAASLAAVADDARPSALVGFDGFVDHIIDVVDQRQDQVNYRSLATIADFGARVSAAAGKSTNFELVVQLTKIGGNGPIMANAMAQAGHGVRYAGIIGGEGVDPVFQPLADGADQVVCMGPPAVTDALEFEDGKLMLGKLTPVDAITFDRLMAAVGSDRLRTWLKQVDGVATVNWTMTLKMTDIWRRLGDEVLPGLRDDRPLWFVDLADPAKRTEEDLKEALAVLRGLQEHVDVVLGMNGSEGRQVVEALGGSWQGDAEDTEAARVCSEAVRERLGIHCAMVHLVGSAAASTASDSVGADGFQCDKPQITTGAGDHFNAGFFGSLLLGLGLQDALLVGGATSGFYVRQARSPQRADLVAFLESWND